MPEKEEMLISNAKRLIEIANKNEFALRVMGALAFRIHCPNFAHLLKATREITDVDFVAYIKQQHQVENMMKEEGFERRLTGVAGLAGWRRIFYDQKNSIVIEVFLDKLEMCHDINFKNRLEVDYPTIPLAEMLLEKIQIVEINEKDVKDAIILLREHEVGDNDKETVNSTYISKILSNDWGFYYTATTNLKKIRKLLGQYEKLVGNEKGLIESRTDSLLESIEKHPKSIGWKMRAKIGTKSPWYRKVESYRDGPTNEPLFTGKS